jgi:hypothetical protein
MAMTKKALLPWKHPPLVQSMALTKVIVSSRSMNSRHKKNVVQIGASVL